MDSGTLSFLGGLLAFLAALTPVLARAWRRAVARQRQDIFRAWIFIITIVLLITGSFVAGYALDRPGIAFLFVALFIAVTGVEFALRPGAINRVEIAAFVVATGLGLLLLCNYATVASKRPAKPSQSSTSKQP
jgi:hypothetical protein